LGTFLQFPSDTLSIGVWKGELVLKDIQLLPDALVPLKLPITVKHGFVRSLLVKIPWTSLAKSPVQIIVDGVLAVGAPQSQQSGLAEAARVFARAIKQARLKDAEAFAARGRKNDKVVDGLVKTIINNLQITIRNVHIRYEDQYFDRGHAKFAAGVMIREFAAFSVDEMGKPAFADAHSLEISRKAVKLTDFAIYWDHSASWWQDLDSKVMIANMESSLTDKNPKHDYIIKPFSAMMDVVINNTYADLNVPKFALKLTLGKVDIHLHQNQYRNFLFVLDRISLIKVKADIAFSFSSVKVLSKEERADPRMRWKYAFLCVKSILMRNRRWNFSLEYLRQTNQQRKAYIDLFRKKLDLSDKKSKEIEKRLIEIEDYLEFETIVLYRFITRSIPRTSHRTSIEKKAKGTPDFWSSMFNKDPALENLESKDAAALKKEVIEVFDLKTALESQMLPSTFVSLQVDLNLSEIHLLLEAKDIGIFAKVNTSCRICIKNYVDDSSNHFFELATLSIESYLDDRKVFHNVLEHDANVMTLSLIETAGTNEQSKDKSIVLNLQKIRVFYSALWIRRMIDFFTLGSDSQANIEHLQLTADSWKNNAQLALLSSLSNRSSLLLRIIIENPEIIFREKKSKKMFIAKISRLHFESRRGDQMKFETVSNIRPDEEIISFYECYFFEIRSTELLCCNESDFIHEKFGSHVAFDEIMPSFDINCIFYVFDESRKLAFCNLYPKNVEISEFLISIVSGPIRVNLSTSNVVGMNNLIVEAVSLFTTKRKNLSRVAYHSSRNEFIRKVSSSLEDYNQLNMLNQNLNSQIHIMLPFIGLVLSDDRISSFNPCAQNIVQLSAHKSQFNLRLSKIRFVLDYSMDFFEVIDMYSTSKTKKEDFEKLILFDGGSSVLKCFHLSLIKEFSKLTSNVKLNLPSISVFLNPDTVMLFLYFLQSSGILESALFIESTVSNSQISRFKFDYHLKFDLEVSKIFVQLRNTDPFWSFVELNLFGFSLKTSASSIDLKLCDAYLVDLNNNKYTDLERIISKESDYADHILIMSMNSEDSPNLQITVRPLKVVLFISIWVNLVDYIEKGIIPLVNFISNISQSRITPNRNIFITIQKLFVLIPNRYENDELHHLLPLISFALDLDEIFVSKNLSQFKLQFSTVDLLDFVNTNLFHHSALSIEFNFFEEGKTRSVFSFTDTQLHLTFDQLNALLEVMIINISLSERMKQFRLQDNLRNALFPPLILPSRDFQIDFLIQRLSFVLEREAFLLSLSVYDFTLNIDLAATYKALTASFYGPYVKFNSLKDPESIHYIISEKSSHEILPVHVEIKFGTSEKNLKLVNLNLELSLNLEANAYLKETLLDLYEAFSRVLGISKTRKSERSNIAVQVYGLCFQMRLDTLYLNFGLDTLYQFNSISDIHHISISRFASFVAIDQDQFSKGDQENNFEILNSTLVISEFPEHGENSKLDCKIGSLLVNFSPQNIRILNTLKNYFHDFGNDSTSTNINVDYTYEIEIGKISMNCHVSHNEVSPRIISTLVSNLRLNSKIIIPEEISFELTVKHYNRDCLWNEVLPKSSFAILYSNSMVDIALPEHCLLFLNDYVIFDLYLFFHSSSSAIKNVDPNKAIQSQALSSKKLPFVMKIRDSKLELEMILFNRLKLRSTSNLSACEFNFDFKELSIMLTFVDHFLHIEFIDLQPNLNLIEFYKSNLEIMNNLEVQDSKNFFVSLSFRNSKVALKANEESFFLKKFLVFSFDFEFVYHLDKKDISDQKRNIRASFSNLKSYLASDLLNHDERLRYLLEPLGITASLKEFSKSNLLFSRDVIVCIDQCMVSLSWNDAKFLAHLVSRVKSIFSYMNLLKNAEISPKTNCSLSLRVEEFNMLFLNDLNVFETPVFRLFLKEIDPSAIEKDGLFDVNLHFLLELNFFNQKSVYWEPIIESVKICFDFEQLCFDTLEHLGNIDNKNAPYRILLQIPPERFKSKLLCPNILNINVSEQFMKVVLETWPLMKDDLESPMKYQSKASSPYLLKNLSGVNLFFWVQTSADAPLVQKIDNLQEVELMIPILGENLQSVHPLLSLQIEGAAWDPIENILMSKEGAQLFTLKPIINGNSVDVVVDISIKHGQKCISVTSAWILKNDTKQILQALVSPGAIKNTASQSSSVMEVLECGASKNSRERILAELNPGEDISVPLDVSHWDMLSVRLVSRDNAHLSVWSKKEISKRVSLAYPKAATFLDFSNGDNGSEIVLQASTVLKFKNRLVTYVFHNPLTFSNLLPVPCSLHVIYPIKNTTVFDTVMEPGTVMELDYCNPLKSPLVKIHVSGYEISGHVKMIKDGNSFVNYVRFVSSSGSVCYFRIENHSRTAASCIFSISIDYWIINQTSINLLFGTKVDDKWNLLANQKSRISYSIFENERGTLFGWKDPFLVSDPSRFTFQNGTKTKSPHLFELPSGYKWATPIWEVEIHEKYTDTNGWRYAKDFDDTFSNAALSNTYVRRRRWFRCADPVFTSNSNILMHGCEPESHFIAGVRLPDGDWGLEFNASVASIDSVLKLIGYSESERRFKDFEIGTLCETAPSQFHKSKIIRVVPRFILFNKLKYTLKVIQKTSNAELSIAPEDSIEFHFDYENNERLLSLKFDIFESSGFFSIEDIGHSQLKCVKEEDFENWISIHFTTQNKDGSIVVVFFPVTLDYPPYLIENFSGFDIAIQQYSSDFGKPEYPVSLIKNNCTVPFYWDDISLPKPLKLIVHLKNLHVLVDLDKVGFNGNVQLDSSYGDAEVINVEVYSIAVSKVLRIFSPRSIAPQLLLPRKNEIQHIKRQLSLSVGALGISFISDLPEELCYIYLDNIVLECIESLKARKIYSRVGKLQVDNLMRSYVSPFKVMFTSENSSSSKVPFFQLLLYQSLNQAHLYHFKYAGMMVQKFFVKLDDRVLENWINAALNVLNQNGESRIFNVYDYFAQLNYELKTDGLLKNSSLEKFVYLEELELYKTSLNLSIYTSSLTLEDVDEERFSQIKVVKQTLGIISKNLDNVSVSLPGLKFDNVYQNSELFIDSLVKHYKWQLNSTLLKLLGSAQILGSPGTLIKSLGKGVKEFISEPVDGLLKGPVDFGFGVIKGSAKLISHSVYGVGNTVAGLTGSLGNAMASLSIDDDYLRQREANHIKEQPSNIVQVKFLFLLSCFYLKLRDLYMVENGLELAYLTESLGLSLLL
jgi:vacuolar protein sorting-associated protein 13A/C